MIHALIGTIVALTFSVLHDVGAVRVLTADSATTFTTTIPTSVCCRHLKHDAQSCCRCINYR
jgi:hypothetical protein